MPSIEIVCLEQAEPIVFDHLPFAVEGKDVLRSHRSPQPLFQVDFNAVRGCIYHLGDPALKDPQANQAYTAWDLLSDGEDFEKWERVCFLPQYAAGVLELLETLIEASPQHRLLFTSDYQFGPPVCHGSEWIELRRFKAMLAGGCVKMNALYRVKQG